MGEPTSVEGRLITPSSSRNKFCMQKLCSVSLLCALLGCALLWVQADPSLDMIDHLLSLEDDISASASAQGGSSAAGSKGALGASSSENAKGKVNSTSSAVRKRAESAKKQALERVNSAKSAANEILNKVNSTTSAVRERAESAKKAALERVDSAKSAANDILGKFNLSLANATSIKWHHVTSMYLSFNKMPLVQKTLSVASCVLFVVTIGLVLKTWKPFHDAPKTMALPALLQAVVTTPGIFSLAGLVSIASPLTHGVCAVAITVQLRGMLSSWCACISIVGGTVTEATDSLASAAEAAPDADTLPEQAQTWRSRRQARKD